MQILYWNLRANLQTNSRHNIQMIIIRKHWFYFRTHSLAHSIRRTNIIKDCRHSPKSLMLWRRAILSGIKIDPSTVSRARPNSIRRFLQNYRAADRSTSDALLILDNSTSVSFLLYSGLFKRSVSVSWRGITGGSFKWRAFHTLKIPKRGYHSTRIFQQYYRLDSGDSVESPRICISSLELV